MKANKALKRLTKIEALLSDVSERYSSGGSHIREAIQDAMAAFARVKAAVSSQAAKQPRVKRKNADAKNAAAEAKPKRRLSAAGRQAIREALKRRWAQKNAAATNADPAMKAAPARKKAAAKKTPAPVQTAAKPAA
jgi:hypothetical protein